MKDTKKIEELLQNTKRDKLNIDLDSDAKYDDITKKLEEEKMFDYDTFTDNEDKVINMKEELENFDYLKDDHYNAQTLNKQPSKEQEEVETIDTTELKQKSTSSSHPIIEYKNVELKINRDQIIQRISLEIYPGEFVYFVGKSGAGKSSLAKMIYKDIKNTSGSIIVDNVNVTKLKSSKLPFLRRKIGIIFQDFKLLNEKTVYENVKYSLDVTGYPSKEKKKQVLKTLKIVGVLDQKDKYPNELSGGQQQRVAIARAIVDDPKIIVADEPTGNLDPKNALAIMEILTKINQTGTTIVMATHDVGIVNKYKNRVILFNQGQIVNESTGGYIYE